MQIYLALVSDPVPTRLMDMGFPREMCVEAITAVGGSLDASRLLTAEFVTRFGQGESRMTS